MNVLQYNQTNIISCSERTRRARCHLFSNKEPYRNGYTSCNKTRTPEFTTTHVVGLLPCI